MPDHRGYYSVIYLCAPNPYCQQLVWPFGCVKRELFQNETKPSAEEDSFLGDRHPGELARPGTLDVENCSASFVGGVPLTPGRDTSEIQYRRPSAKERYGNVAPTPDIPGRMTEGSLSTPKDRSVAQVGYMRHPTARRQGQARNRWRYSPGDSPTIRKKILRNEPGSE